MIHIIAGISLSDANVPLVGEAVNRQLGKSLHRYLHSDTRTMLS